MGRGAGGPAPGREIRGGCRELPHCPRSRPGSRACAACHGRGGHHHQRCPCPQLGRACQHRRRVRADLQSRPRGRPADRRAFGGGQNGGDPHPPDRRERRRAHARGRGRLGDSRRRHPCAPARRRPHHVSRPFDALRAGSDDRPHPGVRTRRRNRGGDPGRPCPAADPAARSDAGKRRPVAVRGRRTRGADFRPMFRTTALSPSARDRATAAPAIRRAPSCAT